MDIRSVFIMPPSMKELEERLRSRDNESEEGVQKRLTQAKIEIEYANTPGFHDTIIINDDLDKACEELERFIFNKT